MKENDARLYVFAGKPAVAGATRSDDARAGTVGVAWIQLVSDRRNGARSDHGSFAARPGFYGGRQSDKDCARTGKGWSQDPLGRRENAAHRGAAWRRRGRNHRSGARRSLCAAGNTAGDSLVDNHGGSAAEGFFT